MHDYREIEITFTADQISSLLWCLGTMATKLEEDGHALGETFADGQFWKMCGLIDVIEQKCDKEAFDE